MSKITKDQEERKRRSEILLEINNIKINPTLPVIESEKETKIRSAKAVAQRVVTLAAVNLVAFDSFSGEEITKYLKEFDLWKHATPNEKTFLAEPTEEAKSQESWKAECIWVLLWALNIVDELGFPFGPADLNDVPQEDFPFGGLDVDPTGFIDHYTELRSKEVIMDAADLYYRFDWACVDARINGQQMEDMHPGVVYERHYAFNWLITYMDQEWDDISCDT